MGSRPISRVLFPGSSGAAIIPLGPQLPTASSNLPEGTAGPALTPSYLVLLRTGHAELAVSPRQLVGSYPTVSPLPALWGAGGLFSVALSRDRSRWTLSSVLPCEARTFLPGPYGPRR